MPCIVDPPYSQSELNSYGSLTHGQLEAVLCGVLSLDESALDRVDWKEAGLSRDVAEKWWTRHKKQDEERRIREAIAEEREAQRQQALSKLSPEEIELLKRIGVN